MFIIEQKDRLALIVPLPDESEAVLSFCSKLPTGWDQPKDHCQCGKNYDYLVVESNAKAWKWCGVCAKGNLTKAELDDAMDADLASLSCLKKSLKEKPMKLNPKWSDEKLAYVIVEHASKCDKPGKVLTLILTEILRAWNLDISVLIEKIEKVMPDVDGLSPHPESPDDVDNDNEWR